VFAFNIVAMFRRPNPATPSEHFRKLVLINLAHTTWVKYSVIRAAGLSCQKAGKAQKIRAGSGFIWGIPV
jgi:hypothetical protein